MEFLKWIFIGIGFVFYIPMLVLMFAIKPIGNIGRSHFYLEEKKQKTPWGEKAEYFYY